MPGRLENISLGRQKAFFQGALLPLRGMRASLRQQGKDVALSLPSA